MIFDGIYEAEKLVVKEESQNGALHYIGLVIDKDEPVFSVSCCCDEDWEWKFWYNKWNYEMVKHIIVDCMFECDSMEELIEDLDETFFDTCGDIVYGEDNFDCNHECGCDGDCANCDVDEFEGNKYLN